jgi:hypothetical protein
MIIGLQFEVFLVRLGIYFIIVERGLVGRYDAMGTCDFVDFWLLRLFV